MSSSRGRGRRQFNDFNGNNNNNYNDNYQYEQSGSPGILSRLGPRSDGGNNTAFSDGQRGGNNRNFGGNRNFDNNNNRGFDNNRNFDDSRGFDNNRNFNNNNNRGFDTNRQNRGGRMNDPQDDLFQPSSNRGHRGGQRGGNRGRGRGFDGHNNDTQQRWRGNNRRQYTRKLADEDIEMGQSAMTDMNGIVVAVSGHPHGSDEKLLGFLQRKSKQPWQPLDVRSEQGTMYISVEDDNSAAAITRMNNFNFGNAVLSIQRADNNGGGMQQPAGRPPGGRSNALEEFLQERWNPQQNFLNLDDLPPTKHSISIVISRLLTVAKDLYGNSLATVSFARNNLWSVKPLKKLPELFPMLQNLSVQDNEIAEFRSLDDFANKFTNLTELMLMGNPIQTSYDFQQYQREVARRFPSVQMLDQQPVGGSPAPAFGATNSPAGFGAAPPSTVPETKGNFFDQPSSQQATQDLLSQYFPLFDSNRAALADLYDEQRSFFSVTVSGSAPYASNTWGQAPRLVVGSANIMQRLIALPPTIHDLTPANIIVDALQTTIPNNVLLSLTIHGQFKEATGANGPVYSFDRVMIVAPAQPGSRAQIAGWMYVILQDSIIVHN